MFSAPELDLLFKYLDTNRDNKLDAKEWGIQLYEDAANPLALIREIVKTNNLTSDELLYMMKLRIWDDALDLPTFNTCMRRLDPTLTDA